MRKEDVAGDLERMCAEHGYVWERGAGSYEGGVLRGQTMTLTRVQDQPAGRATPRLYLEMQIEPSGNSNIDCQIRIMNARGAIRRHTYTPAAPYYGVDPAWALRSLLIDPAHIAWTTKEIEAYATSRDVAIWTQESDDAIQGLAFEAEALFARYGYRPDGMIVLIKR